MQHLKRRHKKKHRSPRLKYKRSPKEKNEEIQEKGSQPVPGGVPDSEQELSGDQTVWWDNRTIYTEGLTDRRPRAVAPDCSVCTEQSG
jgi:hypothetical protein